MNEPVKSSSPPWNTYSKRLVVIVMLVVAFTVLILLRILLLPIIMAVVLAYLVEPVVKTVTQRTPLPRGVTIALLYLIVMLLLISIPVGAISPIVNQINNLLNNTPEYLQQLGEFLQGPLSVSGIEIPIDQLQLDQLYTSISENLLSVAQTVGGQSLSLFGSVASATIATVGWTILVLFLSFYMVKDHAALFASIMRYVPEAHREDLVRLSHELSATWHAFLRGQLVLCLVMALIVFVFALVLGLPNALLLALIGGLAEFLPTIGPIIAAIPAGLMALFQSESSWIGASMTPFWFTLLVLGLYAVIYQLENYYLVPRIIGRHLNLHPLVVILGALAGATVAGLLGILLAAPMLASARLILRYVYHKLTDQPPFPSLAAGASQPDSEDKENEGQ